MNVADQPARALPYFERALADKPTFAEAAINAGLALKALDRTMEAIQMLQRAVKIDPTLAAGFANLGVVLQDVGRIDEAVRACVPHTLDP